MKKIIALSLCFAVMALSRHVMADVLLMDAIMESPPNSPAGLIRPEAGMDRQSVKQRFGEPVEVYAPVGDPPITRWGYPGYSVYFEYDRVITTVIHH